MGEGREGSRDGSDQLSGGVANTGSGPCGIDRSGTRLIRTAASAELRDAAVQRVHALERLPVENSIAHLN